MRYISALGSICDHIEPMRIPISELTYALCIIAFARKNTLSVWTS